MRFTTHKPRNFFFLFILFIYLFSIYVNAVGNHNAVRVLSSFSFDSPFFPSAGLAAVPGWETRGSAQVLENEIRLTQNLPGKSGAIINKRPFFLKTVELTLEFKVHSPGRNGADGMALWLSDQPVTTGPVFGGPNKWNGVAVILDTFDNDGTGIHPLISIHYNNGSSIFDFDTDGSSTIIGSCPVPYRNKDKSFLHLYIEDSKINLFVDANGNDQWVRCAPPTEVKMPTRYFFSISAATGGLSDNHDVMSFKVNTMDPKLSLANSDMNKPDLIDEEIEEKIIQTNNENKPDKQKSEKIEDSTPPEPINSQQKNDKLVLEDKKEDNQKDNKNNPKEDNKDLNDIIIDPSDITKTFGSLPSDISPETAEKITLALQNHIADDKSRQRDWENKEKLLRDTQLQNQLLIEEKNAALAKQYSKHLDCDSINAECENALEIYTPLSKVTEEVIETFGHEIAEVQYLFSDSIKDIRSMVSPISKNFVSLQNDISQVSAQIEQFSEMIDQLTNFMDLSVNGKKNGPKGEHYRLLESLTTVQRTLVQLQVEQRKSNDRLEIIKEKSRKSKPSGTFEFFVASILAIQLLLQLIQYFMNKKRTRRSPMLF